MFRTALATARAVDSATSGARNRMIDASRDRLRICDPVIYATTTQRLGKIARPIRSQDHERLRGGSDRATFWNRDLEIRQEFEEYRLEFVIRPIDLVDQKRMLVWRPKNLQQGTCNQKSIFINVDLAFARLADREQLTLVVPLIESMRGVDALVALQAYEAAAKRFSNRFRGLRLADARRPFKKERLPQADG